MAFTEYTDFTAKYKLPNTVPSDPEGADLAVFIADYENEYLTELLGYKTAKDFLADFTPPAVPATAKWLALYSGAEFTDKYGRLNKWPGLKNSEGLSPVMMYIYCKWQMDRQTYTSGSGERVVLTENSIPVSVRGKVVKAWNDMVDMNFILDDFLTQNKADYPDYPGIYGDLINYGNIKFFKPINIFNV